MAGSADKVLAEKKIELPKAAAPVANYVPVVIAGSLAFVSGQVTVGNSSSLASWARNTRSSRGNRRRVSAASTSWPN